MVTEIELADMNLEPLTELSEGEEAHVEDVLSWRQLSRDEKRDVNLVVAPSSNKDLVVHQVREIGERILLFKKARVELSSDTISAELVNKDHLKNSNTNTEHSGRGRKYTDEGLIEEIQRLHDKLERPPTKGDITTYGLCSAQTISKRFGSLDEARERAGVGQPEIPNKISRDELTHELERLEEKLGRVPSISDIEEHSKYSYGPYWREFGGIVEAIAEADIRGKAPDRVTVEDWREFKKENRPELEENELEYTDEALLSELQHLAESLGRRPGVDDIREHSKYSYKPFRNRWDTIRDAREAAGVEDYSPDEDSEMDE